MTGVETASLRRAGGSVAQLNSPFNPDNDDAFARWRERKLDGYPRSADDLLVEVADPRALSKAEAEALLVRCRKANMALYKSALGDQADKDVPRRLGKQFGLRRLDPNMLADDDGITSLHVVPGKSLRGYIPYSSRRLLWHTDGYYNPPERRIRSFILHCVAPAAEGGENHLLDPELVYLYMRQMNPRYVRALMATDVMTIPANTEPGEEARAAQSGPVFSIDPSTGNLHMRYTARTRSIEWKKDPVTQAAVACLQELLSAGNDHVFWHRLAAGEGVISNNVLHSRTAFEDCSESGQQRLIYRARYYDRIAGTDVMTAAEG